MTSWLALIIFLIAIVIGWRYPRVGVGLAVVALPTYVIKFAIGPLPTQLQELILLGVGLGWLIRQPSLNLRAWWNAVRPVALPTGLLLLGVVIGTAVSSDLRLSLGIAKGWFVEPLILFGLIVAIWPKTSLHGLIGLLALSTLPLSFGAIGQVLTLQFITIDGRASAWFESANYLSLYLVPILLMSGPLFYHRSLRWLAWVSWLAGVVAIYFSFSYGGWLALVVGGLVLGFWQLRRNWKLGLISSGAIIAAIASQLTTDRVARMVDLTSRSSASVRLQVWATDWLMIKQSWWVGLGLGQYPLHYPTFVGRLFASPLEPAMLHAHNLYFQFLINTGVIGLVGFLGLVVKFFSWLRRSPAGFVPPLSSAMVAVLTHGLIDTPYWKPDLALLFWVLLAIGYLVGQPSFLSPHEQLSNRN